MENKNIEWVGEAESVNNWKGECYGLVRHYRLKGAHSQQPRWAWTRWYSAKLSDRFTAWVFNFENHQHARTRQEAAAYLVFQRERISL